MHHCTDRIYITVIKTCIILNVSVVYIEQGQPAATKQNKKIKKKYISKERTIYATVRAITN